MQTDPVAPTIVEIEALAARAFAAIPAVLRKHALNVVIRVEDFPDDETLDDLGIESPFDLLGLYRGVDLTRKSVADAPQDVDMVLLYRRPLLDYWIESGETLGAVVAHVLVHEIGHHFGFSDDDMERIEAAAEE